MEVLLILIVLYKGVAIEVVPIGGGPRAWDICVGAARIAEAGKDASGGVPVRAFCIEREKQ